MARKPSNYEDILADELADAILASGDQIAAGQGGPADSQRPTSKEELAVWGRSDPSVRYEELRDRLLGGGIPPEEAQNLLIVKRNPDMLAGFVQPKDAVQADVLARLAEYPYRPDLYRHLDPHERVSKAASLARSWQQSRPQPSAAPLVPTPQPPMSAPVPPVDPLPLGG